MKDNIDFILFGELKSLKDLLTSNCRTLSKLEMAYKSLIGLKAMALVLSDSKSYARSVFEFCLNAEKIYFKNKLFIRVNYWDYSNTDLEI